jgi:hypothetical protein
MALHEAMKNGFGESGDGNSEQAASASYPVLHNLVSLFDRPTLAR